MFLTVQKNYVDLISRMEGPIILRGFIFANVPLFQEVYTEKLLLIYANLLGAFDVYLFSRKGQKFVQARI